MEPTAETIIVYLTPDPTIIPTATPTFTPLPSYTPIVTSIADDIHSMYDYMGVPILQLAFWFFLISMVLSVAIVIIKVILSQR